MRSHEQLICALVGLEPIKIWSLIVTLLGDLGGDGITGKQLRAILQPIGIKPGAMRVAIHRLKQDDWIVTQKSGREASYQLSRKGMYETCRVYGDVYRQDVKYPDGWRLIITARACQDMSRLSPRICMGRNLCLVPREIAVSDGDALDVEIMKHPLPEWFQVRFLDDGFLAMAQKLSLLAGQVEALEPNCDMHSSLRLLLLHRWRKMALRPACWAHISMIPDGPVARCHSFITRFLSRTDRLSGAAHRAKPRVTRH